MGKLTRRHQILLAGVAALAIVVLFVSTRTGTSRSAPAGAVSFALSPQAGAVEVGETLDVDVLLAAGSFDVAFVDFTVGFPPSALTLVEFTPSAALNTAIVNSPPNNGNGTFRYVGGNSSPNRVTGAGVVLGTLHFTGGARGTAQVSLTPNEVTDRASLSDLNATGAAASYVVGPPQTGGQTSGPTSP